MFVYQARLPVYQYLLEGSVGMLRMFHQAEAGNIEHHDTLDYLVGSPGSRDDQICSVSRTSSEQDCVNSQRRRSKILVGQINLYKCC